MYEPHFRMPEAIAMLVDVWKSLSEENVRKAWKDLAELQ